MQNVYQLKFSKTHLPKLLQLGGSLFWYLTLESGYTFPFKIFDSINNAEEVVVDEERKEKNPNKYSLAVAEVNDLGKKN